MNQKWVIYVTELKCALGKLYLSPIKDLFNGEIITYNLARSSNLKKVIRMIKQAVAKLPKGVTSILYFDQG